MVALAAGAPERKRLPLWLELAETALVTLLIFVLVRFAIVNFRVDGLSMSPTLAHGEYLLINRVAYLALDARFMPGGARPDRCIADRCYLLRPPTRGDIVVFWPSRESDRPYIKRIIALPGESVEVRDGRVWVSGQMLTEPYIKERITYSQAKENVPPGTVYVLGDNRNHSEDSHRIGSQRIDSIIGQATFCYLPVSCWRWLTAPSYQAVPRAGPPMSLPPRSAGTM